jgi:hypothetical protein
MPEWFNHEQITIDGDPDTISHLRRAMKSVRGTVELFRLVKRENELHREILAFSISHDHSTVRIYGHYALIDGSKTTFYRHLIKKFDFTSEEGKDKWTSS